MAKKNNETSLLLNELQDIKKLIMLVLLEHGISQEKIAAALNINQSSVSRMFPKGPASK